MYYPLTAFALEQSIFEQRMVAVNKKFSYQDPKHVADGLSHIWNEEHKRRAIADCLDITEGDCKVQLNNISIRRNQIVHQGDYPDEMSSSQEIFLEDDLVVKNFIIDLGAAIFNLVKL